MANSDLAWLKWFPARAQNSLRWQSLALEERGLFHELYDLAALASPRGALVAPDGCDLDALLAVRLRLEVDDFRRILGALVARRLIVRDEAQGLIFPDFATHQRNAPARVRRKDGAGVARKRRKSGAPEVEVEVEVEGEKNGDKGRKKKARISPDSAKPVRARILFDAASRSFLNIMPTDLGEWAEAYPATKPDLELKRMIQWLLANPTKAVKRNWRRFITNWLARTQDGGGTRGTQTGKGLENGKPSRRTYRASQQREA